MTEKTIKSAAKYAVIILLIIMLSVFFMLLPNIGEKARKDEENNTVKTVKLTASNEKLSKKDKAVIFADTMPSSCLVTEIFADRAISEYYNDCCTLINNLFGENEAVTELLIKEINDASGNQKAKVTGYKYTTFYLNETVNMNLILAQYGNLVIWYEEEDLIPINVNMLAPDSYAEESKLNSEYAPLLYSNKAISKYYGELGLDTEYCGIEIPTLDKTGYLFTVGYFERLDRVANVEIDNQADTK